MKPLILCGLLAALSGPALADLYRCEENGKTVYRDTYCPEGAKIKLIMRQPAPPPPPPEARINANAYAPTLNDAAAARLRAHRVIGEANALEQAEEQQRQQRDHAYRMDLQRQAADAAAQNAKNANCQRAEIDVTRIEADARGYQRDAWWQNRARAARDKFRMDCW